MATQARTRRSSPNPHQTRLKALAALAAAQGADALLVTDPVDVGYLTGFLGGDSSLYVPASGKPTVISDFRYQEDLESVKPISRVVIRKGSISDEVVKLLEKGRKRRKPVLAYQAESLTVAALKHYTKALRSIKLGASNLKATTGLVDSLRVIKDAGEVRTIKKAIEIQEAALLAIKRKLKPGLSELEICAMLEMEMKKRGASDPAFHTIVAARANGSLPHYAPSTVTTAANKPLLIDWGAKFKGYHGDMTRTFSFGRWPSKVREIYEIVLDAQLMAADAIAPGKTCLEVDAVARNHIKKHGYAKQFGHGLGHGLGMNVHESPRLNQLFADRELEPGMVVTVEPGIYLPGVGGVRIEDDYVVTAKGSRNLSSLPKDLEWSTL